MFTRQLLTGFGVCALSLLVGCSSQPTDPMSMRQRASEKLRTPGEFLLYAKMELDEGRRPAFSQRLTSKPTTPGGRYYVVSLRDGRVDSAKAIALCAPQPEGYFIRSLKSGTERGAQMSSDLMSMPAVPTAPAELHVVGSTMPILLGAVAGGIAGLSGSGEQHTAVDVDIADLSFAYDSSGRIKSVALALGAGADAQFNVIDYYYRGSETVPFSAQPAPEEQIWPGNYEVSNCLRS